MRWSLGVAVAVAVAAVAVAVPARAQEQPGDIVVDEAKKPRASIFPSLNQFSGYGFSAGVMKVMGGDLGENTQPKLIMQTVFRYRFSDKWIGTGEFGFGWNSFKDRGDTVVTFTFGTLGAVRQLAHRYGNDLRAGGGLGFYRWNYKFKGHSLRDADYLSPSGTLMPGTQRFYRGISPGGFLGAENEYRLTRHVTLLGLLQWHYVLTADEDLFNSLFDENHSLLSFRVSANFHFSPYEGILWERKKVTKIRLESGKEGL